LADGVAAHWRGDLIERRRQRVFVAAGLQPIGLSNRTFKATTGLTPTASRCQRLAALTNAPEV